MMDTSVPDDNAPLNTEAMTMRSIKDPIHDLITFSAYIWTFIDTRQFQRLRHIKQLGVSYYVWAGAAHNRFEHCLGVAHLAGMLVERLKLIQPELGITDRDVLCVRLAGLCHDLGHGPWSHVWDGQFIPAVLPGTKWTHEDASEMMFDELVEQNGIVISLDDVNFVKDLIKGVVHHSRDKYPPEKKFLFDIVANKRNGIDVDKFDYLARDIRAIGDHNNFSARRLIESARVIDDEICYHIKDANQIYELCYLRFSNHKRIYSHKTARAIEYMIIDALKAAEPTKKIAKLIMDPKKYVYLTDEIMGEIEKSEEPELAESRAIFERIRLRNLYKCVDYKTFPWVLRDRLRQVFTPERIVQAAKALFQSSGSTTSNENAKERPSAELIAGLTKDHVVVDMSLMHYGMKDKNPVNFVKFYGKHNVHAAFNAEPGDFSILMPACFGEVLFRIYTKEADFYGLIQAGYRELLQTLSEDTAAVEQPILHDPPTPPITEAPSTPRALSTQPDSRNASFTSVASVPAPEMSPSSMSRGTVRTTPGPFAHNKFTSVSTTYAPKSPQAQYRRSKTRAGSAGLIKGSPFSVHDPGSGSPSADPSLLTRDISPSPALPPRLPSALQPSPPIRGTRSGGKRTRGCDKDNMADDSSTSQAKKKKVQ